MYKGEINMNSFTENELNCYNKVLGAALRKVDRSTVTKQEFDITVELLKKNADNRSDWTEEQKRDYKILADSVKENFKG
jgi:hypothetical protein